MLLACHVTCLPACLPRHATCHVTYRAEYMNLYELFHARASMHRQVYTHK